MTQRGFIKVHTDGLPLLLRLSDIISVGPYGETKAHMIFRERYEDPLVVDESFDQVAELIAALETVAESDGEK